MNAQTLYLYGIHHAFLQRNKTNLHYHLYYNRVINFWYKISLIFVVAL